MPRSSEKSACSRGSDPWPPNLRRPARIGAAPPSAVADEEVHPALRLQRHGQDAPSMAFKDLASKRATSATRSTSTPSPKTCSIGTTTWRRQRAGAEDQHGFPLLSPGFSELEMDKRIRPLLQPLCRLRFQNRLRESGKSASRARSDSAGDDDSGRTSRFPAAKRTSSSGASSSRSCSSYHRRGRGLQLGQVHLHRRPDFVAGRAQRHRGRQSTWRSC